MGKPMCPDSTHMQSLLNGAAQGDQAAIGELLDRHRDALRRMVQSRFDPALAARLDASDIVQEVMIEANRRLSGYLRDPALPFHLWLRQIARDRLIDAHRRHQQAARRSLRREQPLVPPAWLDHSTLNLAAAVYDDQHTPAAAALWHELHRRFVAALETLEETDREVVYMRHFEQLANCEVAATLGLSEPAAAMRYLRALRRLRALLAEAPSISGTSP